MIYYDITKTGSARHRSGITRVSARLREELGSWLASVQWEGRSRGFVDENSRQPVAFTSADWLLTVELFSEEERPGFWDFLHLHPCRLAAIFHDAIPLKMPHQTWPQSVRRHPEYMKMLASFDRVWGVSEAVRLDLAGFWRWQGVNLRAELGTIGHGADFDGCDRVQRDPVIAPGRPALLCVGIVEPRKNQGLLLDVAEGLWAEGMDFSLDVAGRVNPHFGEALRVRMQKLQQRERRFRFHLAPGDKELGQLYSAARATVFPTVAEGCGLPVLEALWRGVPCVASDLPALKENAEGGGCLLARVNDVGDWREKFKTILTDEVEVRRLQGEAMARPLPRWADTAQTIKSALR